VQVTIKPHIAWDGRTMQAKTILLIVLSELKFRTLSRPEICEEVFTIKLEGSFSFHHYLLWNLHEVPRDEYRYTFSTSLGNSGFKQ
jgi:hypothetical protein